MGSMRHKTIAAQVKAWREHRGLSQRGLALAAGVSDTVVQKLESGYNRDPRLSTCQRLALALGVTLAELVDGRPAKAKRTRGTK